jgi:hypothetical protein
MKKAKKLAISKETLRNLEIHSVSGGDDPSWMDTQCAQCNTADTICYYVVCFPPPPPPYTGYTC